MELTINPCADRFTYANHLLIPTTQYQQKNKAAFYKIRRYWNLLTAIIEQFYREIYSK